MNTENRYEFIVDGIKYSAWKPEPLSSEELKNLNSVPSKTVNPVLNTALAIGFGLSSLNGIFNPGNDSSGNLHGDNLLPHFSRGLLSVNHYDNFQSTPSLSLPDRWSIPNLTAVQPVLVPENSNLHKTVEKHFQDALVANGESEETFDSLRKKGFEVDLLSFRLNSDQSKNGRPDSYTNLPVLILRDPKTGEESASIMFGASSSENGEYKLTSVSGGQKLDHAVFLAFDVQPIDSQNALGYLYDPNLKDGNILVLTAEGKQLYFVDPLSKNKYLIGEMSDSENVVDTVVKSKVAKLFLGKSQPETLAPTDTPEATATPEIGEFIPANDIEFVESLPNYDLKLAPDADRDAIYWDIIVSHLGDAISKSKGMEANRAVYEEIIKDHPEWDGIGNGWDYKIRVEFMKEFLTRTGGQMIVTDMNFNKMNANFNEEIKFEVKQVNEVPNGFLPTLSRDSSDSIGRGTGLGMYIDGNGQIVYSVAIVNNTLEFMLHEEERSIYKITGWTESELISDLFRMLIASTATHSRVWGKVSATNYKLYVKGSDPDSQGYYLGVTWTFIK